jgi:hypothetical protein
LLDHNAVVGNAAELDVGVSASEKRLSAESAYKYIRTDEDARNVLDRAGGAGDRLDTDTVVGISDRAVGDVAESSQLTYWQVLIFLVLTHRRRRCRHDRQQSQWRDRGHRSKCRR